MSRVMPPARAQEIAATFDLRALPPDFYASPYPVYDVLRDSSPVHLMPDGSYFLFLHLSNYKAVPRIMTSAIMTSARC